jgi:hypothetical protein
VRKEVVYVMIAGVNVTITKRAEDFVNLAPRWAEPEGWDHSDGVVLSDEAYNLDPEQGLPDMRGGVLCKVYPV